MRFWRTFLTLIGLACGTILGLFVVAITQWLDGLLAILLGGAFLGAACGWAISPLVPKIVERLKERFPPDIHPLPPPRNVLRLGLALGIAEGITVGLMYGGIMAAILGGFFGMRIGLFAAELSWRVRRNIPLILLGLFLGFLIEVAGCLLIVGFYQALAVCPPLMYIFCGELAVLLVLWLMRRYREWRATRQDENFGPETP